MAVTISGKYEGNLNSIATHGPSGDSLKTTAPTDNGGDGSTFSATDLIPTGLGTCMLTIMGLWAKKHGFDVEGSTFTVEKHMSTDTPRRIVAMPITFDVRGNVPEDKRESMEASANKCPVKASLADFIEVTVTYNYH